MTSVFLLDIEGTTTPVRFVYDVLFPYARVHAPDFLRAHWNDPELQTARAQFDEDSRVDKREGAPAPIDPARLIAYFGWLMDRDRKSTPLKTVQGLIWSAGYKSGELRSEVFHDVPAAFRRWRDAGKRIAIYSSGSALAQRELFRYTRNGDLTPFIDNYFDTQVGAKREAQSYARIAKELGTSPDEVLFVSDVVAELDAAKMSRLATRLCVRPGNAPVVDVHGHTIVLSFDELD